MIFFNMSKAKLQSNIIWRKAKTVTMDTSADFQRLKKLQDKQLIRVEKVSIENDIKQVCTTHTTVGILGAAHLPFRLGPYDIYETILSIIGKQNINDAMILEAHIHSGNDYFVTNNVNDFIKNGKREKLQAVFRGLRILLIGELESLLKN